MKKTVLFAFAAVVALISTSRQGVTNPNGAPAQVSGSPTDGQTCAKSGCHTGGPGITDHVATITSNVPTAGYTPGTTYTITGTATKSGISRFGFEISPQSQTGALMGTLIAGTDNHLVGGSKYVTHSQNGTSASGTRSWNFQWTAPAAGSGPVTFYGSFLFANNNGNESGDAVKTATLTINENVSSGINEATLDHLVLAPNPATSELKIYHPGLSSKIEISITDLSGRTVQNQKVDALNGSAVVELGQNMNNGVYFLTITSNGNTATKRFVKL